MAKQMDTRDMLSKQIHVMGAEMQSANAAIMGLMKQNDEVYRERDKLVAALTKLFPSHLTRHKEMPGENWDPLWLNVVCVHLPTGQATWHIHLSELAWFSHLGRIKMQCEGYNGYTTEEKYQRLFRLPVAWR